MDASPRFNEIVGSRETVTRGPNGKKSNVDVQPGWMARPVTSA